MRNFYTFCCDFFSHCTIFAINMERGIPKMVTDYVLVEVEKEFQDKFKHGSLELEMHDGITKSGMNRSKYVTKSGIVKSIPSRLHVCKDIEPEIQVGDEVHFHYNSIDEDSELVIDGKTYHMIMYEMILASVRGEEVIPIGGIVLCEPIYDNNEGEEFAEIELPDGGSETVRRRSGSGIILDIKASHNHKEARVAYIGSPLKSKPKLDVENGDRVMYLPNADFDNAGDTINGKKYFYMHQDELICKIYE